jgi:hypothetical protein
MTKPIDEILGSDYDAALAQVADQKTQAAVLLDSEVSVHENPRLADMQGASKVLIAAGHEPSGSTATASSDFDGAATAKPSTKRFDPRDKRVADEQKFEGYVIVSGSFGKVKEALKSFAEAHGKDTLIAREQGSEIGLTEKLTNNEVAHLARYGATCLTGNKQPITLNASAAAPVARA